MNRRIRINPTFIRISPFILFMGFVALEECLRAINQSGFINLEPSTFFWLYPPKAGLVCLMIVVFWRHYNEITFTDLLTYRNSIISIISGIIVFLLWIKMDWSLEIQSPVEGFNPNLFNNELTKWLMIFVRLSGAVIVVPIMEELFWRSFLLRYLINQDFINVNIGQFNILSFSVVTVLFALEHHYIFAGVMAGVIFNIVYYVTKSISHCILSHATANFCLGLFVLITGEWRFW
ncbi:MAG: CAAX prenyl protease-related protein [Deltaproteobacteria bacterium]|jgi:CAAX prenyl protease-like protein|nr:CAAX prenyl protease-related protein [Deltaproteobacteria bacterium]